MLLEETHGAQCCVHNPGKNKTQNLRNVEMGQDATFQVGVEALPACLGRGMVQSGLRQKYQGKQDIEKEKYELMSIIIHRNHWCVVVYYPADLQLRRNSIVWAQDHGSVCPFYFVQFCSMKLHFSTNEIEQMQNENVVVADYLPRILQNC